MTKLLLVLGFLYFPSLLFCQSKEDIIKRIKSNPSDMENIHLIQQIDRSNPDYKELKSLYKLLDKKVKKSTQGKFLDRYIQALEASSVGKKAPGITQFDLSGMPYSLQDLKGKYVLVSFWASWNTLSRQDIPALQRIYAEFKDKNFEILGVSFDSDFQTWEKYVKENQLEWKHISDLQNMNNGAALYYGIKAIPQNALVDPNGIIIARNISTEALQEKLSTLLK